jgi:hypothetical protein
MASVPIFGFSIVPTGWSVLKIGAGGFNSGISIAPDGTKAIRTDTYGAYVWNPSVASPGNTGGLGAWQQLCTTALPSTVWNIAQGSTDAAGGVYEVCIAPSQTSRIYMLFNGYVVRSDNSGASWTLTNFAQVTGILTNSSPSKTFGRYIAVDPANSNIVYVSTPSNGCWYSTDGMNFSQITALGTGTTISGDQGGGHLIAFDPTSSVVSNVTQGILVSTYGTGVYKTTNGGGTGGTWSLTTDTPTTHQCLIYDKFGIAWMADYTNQDLYKLPTDGTTWSSVSVSGGVGINTVAVDPASTSASTSTITLTGNGGTFNFSTNGGSSFIGWYDGSNDYTATDVPWLGWTSNTYDQPGLTVYDPSQTSTLYVPSGIGTFKIENLSPPSDFGTITLVSQNAGIEQLVGNVCSASPSGAIALGFWDRSIYAVVNPNVYPSTLEPNNGFNACWDLDWCPTSTNFFVGINVSNTGGPNISGYSSNGGSTWTEFSGAPSSVNPGVGGIIAFSTTDFVWIVGNNGNAYYTTNTGASWSACTFPANVPTSGTTGWGGEDYLSGKRIAVDRVTSGVGYAYNYEGAGIYKTTNSGANWTQVYTGNLSGNDSFNSLLETVPGNAGHLFWTAGSGFEPHPTNTEWLFSTNGGTSWTAVNGFLEVICFGFGTTFSGQSYPAIAAVGWYNGGSGASYTYGIWECRNFNPSTGVGTWTQIGPYPLNSFDSVKSIDGDKNTPGKWYLANNGSGFKYYTGG